MYKTAATPMARGSWGSICGLSAVCLRASDVEYSYQLLFEQYYRV